MEMGIIYLKSMLSRIHEKLKIACIRKLCISNTKNNKKGNLNVNNKKPVFKEY